MAESGNHRFGNLGNLVITRRPLQSVRIGEDVTITIVEVWGQNVRIAIRAPRSMRILRTELDEEVGRDGTDRDT